MVKEEIVTQGSSWRSGFKVIEDGPEGRQRMHRRAVPFLAAVLYLGFLPNDALCGAVWTPQGGDPVPAESGTYTGTVTKMSPRDGPITWSIICTFGGTAGVLSMTEADLSQEQEEVLNDAVQQNDNDNWAQIAQDAVVSSVGTGPPSP